MTTIHLNYVTAHGQHAHLNADGSLTVGIPVTDRDGVPSTELHVCRTIREIRLALGY